MPARTPTRTHRPARDSIEFTLPWWAVALPALAFAALLLLVLEPGQAHAAAGEPVLGRLVARILAFLGL